jgi:hypothetical protein
VDASNRLHDITRDIAKLSHSSDAHLDTAKELAAMLEGVKLLSDSSNYLIEIHETVGHLTRQINGKPSKRHIYVKQSNQICLNIIRAHCQTTLFLRFELIGTGR